MNIGVFCPSFGALGGIEEIATRLSAEFSRQGHFVTILARGPRSHRTTAGEVPIFREPFHQLPRRQRHFARQIRFRMALPSVVSRFRAILTSRRIDVMLTLAISTYAPYIERLARRVPVVMSLQGGEAAAGLTSNPRRLRAALSAAFHVVACAKSIADEAHGLAAAAKVSIIPNGVDLAQFSSATPFAHPRPFVLAVGRLVKQKGFDTLLEAFARLEPPVPTDLLVAGDGPERTLLEGIASRLDLRSRVRFLGVQSRDTLPSLYHGAAVVACPSRWEGLPLVCLEAMASGRPIVATTIDGIPDALTHGETGLLVPPDDAASFAQALRRLLCAPDLAERMGLAARDAVRERFTWEAIACQYLGILREAAAG